MPDPSEDLKKKHWSEILAERVVREKKPPYVITSGITTSGPVHLGTLCEFLYPEAIRRQLEFMGHSAEFYFIADIYDAFDSVPLIFEKHRAMLEPHLGKPLSDVPDPVGCHPSFGEHFLAEVLAIMERFAVRPKIIRANELYRKGEWDRYALLFFEQVEKTRAVVAESSLKKESAPDWSPLMPICGRCGKVATTVVTSHTKDSYNYSCTRDVGYARGCGYKGENKISDHRYKITWRLHWPTWQDYFKTSIEGAGMDHHTRGGSWDTAVAIHRQIFGHEPPVGYKYGFVLLKGKKYSKSRGIGMGVSDLLELMPPELIKYALLRPDLQENKDIDPTGVKMISLYNDFLQASGFDRNDPKLARAERKKAIAFSLATDKMRWKAGFTDVLMHYQLYRDWGKVGELLGDPMGVEYLRPYIERWLEKKFAPDEYSFSFNPSKVTENRQAVLSFAKALKDGMSAVEIHNLVFDIAKREGVDAAELFKALYRALISKDMGPRLGKLVEAIGVPKVRATLMEMTS